MRCSSKEKFSMKSLLFVTCAKLNDWRRKVGNWVRCDASTHKLLLNHSSHKTNHSPRQISRDECHCGLANSIENNFRLIAVRSTRSSSSCAVYRSLLCCANEARFIHATKQLTRNTIKRSSALLPLTHTIGSRETKQRAILRSYNIFFTRFWLCCV